MQIRPDLFGTQMVFLKKKFKKFDFEKNQQTTKKHENFTGGKELREIIFQVVNVWEHNLKDKKVDLKQPLYGHTEPVTCVAASSAYHIIVSGSRDRTCILWDLSRLVYVRQLRGHTAPVAAVCVNELTVSGLTLCAPITTKVICFSHLLKCLRSLYGKQCGPRSDCSYRSSLFWVHTVCFYT